MIVFRSKTLGENANMLRLPDHISFDAAALLEPLSVAIHSLNRAAPTPGSTALVIGAGTVGLLVAAMARHSGCAFVTIMDVDAGRVAYALEHGFATHGYVVPKPLHSSASSSSIFSSSGSGMMGGVQTPSSDGAMTPFGTYERLVGARGLAADVLAVAREDMPALDEDEDEGVDMTFECTGKEPCMQTSLYATKPGGKVIMVGMVRPARLFPEIKDKKLIKHTGNADPNSTPLSSTPARSRYPGYLPLRKHI